MIEDALNMGSYVVTGMVAYEVDKLRKGFDLAFEAMHSLDSVYHVEAPSLCTVLE